LAEYPEGLVEQNEFRHQPSKNDPGQREIPWYFVLKYAPLHYWGAVTSLPDPTFQETSSNGVNYGLQAYSGSF
jgi:hypothetical protein